MNRRSFLKLLSASMATVAAPVPLFKLAEPAIIIQEMPITLGAIRTWAAFDITRDEWHVRMDAYNGRDQWHVDFKVDNVPNIRESYLRNREVASEVLRNSLIHEKWKASDLIALPTPHGYVAPPWMSA